MSEAKESMKATDKKGAVYFAALCAIALISAVAFPFAREADDDVRRWLTMLTLVAPAGLLVWSIVSFRKNLVRGSTGILVLLIAGSLALVVTGWRVNERIKEDPRESWCF